MKREVGREYENGVLTLTTSIKRKAWMAEIAGTDETYIFARKFLEVLEDGGRWFDYKLEDGKLYCWSELSEQHFGIMENGKLYEINKNDALEIIKNK